MSVPYKAWKLLLRSLKKRQLKGFAVNTGQVLEWKRILVPVSYCCDISERKDTSKVRHGVAVCRPCLGFIVSVEDIVGGRMCIEGY